MVTVFIGIDPGISGALAVLDGDQAFVDDLPTLTVRRGKTARTELDLNELVAAFEAISARYEWQVIAAIEAQHALPASMKGAISNYSIGRSYGAIEALVVAGRWRYELVPASTWKRAVGLAPKATKGDAVKLARQRWPKLAPQLLISKDGRAEALLIAEWLRRQNEKGSPNVSVDAGTI